MLTQMGHPQPATPLKIIMLTLTRSYTTISLKISQNHGICGSIGYRTNNKNQNFDIYWDAGHNKLTGYYTKHKRIFVNLGSA